MWKTFKLAGQFELDQSDLKDKKIKKSSNQFEDRSENFNFVIKICIANMRVLKRSRFNYG